MSTAAYAAMSATTPLVPHTITRRDPGPSDVAIEVLFCGICHSDIHFARSEWFPVEYPIVPGHEIIGQVTGVGKDVTKFREGQIVGVGCLVDSCRTCPSCMEGLENYCTNGFTLTYGSPDVISGGYTYGGYSTAMVVDERFVCSVPNGLDPAGAAPLLCAGITTYSPLRNWKVGPGSKVGVIGLGGLGHMAVKIATAMGAEVTVFTRTPSKLDDAKALGAVDTLISTDGEAMAGATNTFDFIVDTVSAEHDLAPYVATLRRDGTICMVGISPDPLVLPLFPLVFQRKAVAGSGIGGLPETQEMLDFCGEHGITADIEMIGMPQVNEAWERVLTSDVKYRFVIDMASLK